MQNLSYAALHNPSKNYERNRKSSEIQRKKTYAHQYSNELKLKLQNVTATAATAAAKKTGILKINCQ